MRLRRHHHTIAAAEGARPELRVDVTDQGSTWSLTNRSAWPTTVRSVAVVHSLGEVDGQLRRCRAVVEALPGPAGSSGSRAVAG